MARTRYASDPGLIARMGATMFLLGLVFAGFATGLVYLIAYYSSYRHGGGGSTANVDVLIFFAAVHRHRQCAGFVLLVRQDRAAHVRCPAGGPE